MKTIWNYLFLNYVFKIETVLRITFVDDEI